MIMQHTIMDILFTDAMAKVLCWTLVHSLWQGLLAAALAGVIILGTRRSAAVRRYNLLTGTLLLFLAVAAATFFYELRLGGQERVSVGTHVLVSGGAVTVTLQGDAAAPASTLLERTGEYLNAHASVVVLVWMACLLGQLVRLTGGLYQIRRLRRNKVFAAPDHWNERLAALVARLGIKKSVRLLQSAIVRVPVTFGFLKPVILVPFGMLANLPADQAESILLHELAHIARGDYMANLLLYISEAVFFFNPGIRWVASLIRQEREACCDDVVLAGVEDRNSYFDALVAFREYALGGQPLLLPLGGKNDLLWRIRRMLQQENKNLHVMEKTILSFGLMAIVTLGLISMRNTDGPARDTAGTGAAAGAGRTATLKVKVMRDTLPDDAAAKHTHFPSVSISTDNNGFAKTVHITATDDEGNTYEMKRKGGDIVEIIINGKTVPKEEYHKYGYIFDTLAGEINDERPPVPPVPPVPAVAPTPAVDATPAGAPVPAIAPTEPPTPAMSAEPIAPVAEPIAPVAPVPPVPQHGLTPRPPVAPQPPNVADTIADMIISDLKKAGLIKEQQHLSFQLDVNGLIVDGEKAPAAIERALIDKYVKDPRDHYILSRTIRPDGSSTHSEIRQEKNRDEYPRWN